jgi:hypothetical protein
LNQKRIDRKSKCRISREETDKADPDADGAGFDHVACDASNMPLKKDRKDSLFRTRQVKCTRWECFTPAKHGRMPDTGLGTRLASDSLGGREMNRSGTRFKAFAVLTCLACGIAFSGNPSEANRDAIKKALIGLADRAQEYYRKPRRLGGGEGSFALITLSTLTGTRTQAYGSFSLSSPSASSVTLDGTGVETGNDESTPVQVVVVVFADSMSITVTN